MTVGVAQRSENAAVGQNAGADSDWVNPDLTTATYDSVSVSLNPQDGVPYGLCFSADGTSMYVTGHANERVYQYTLSAAWDLSTASYTRQLSTSSKEDEPSDIRFSPDGLKMFIVGSQSDSVHQYALSTAWNIGSASFTASFDVSSEELFPYALHFSADGLIMYVAGNSQDKVFQYTLSSPWTISGATYSGKSYAPGGTVALSAIFFSPDGKKLFTTGQQGPVRQHSLSTAWDVSTASYDSISFDATSQELYPRGLFFKSDGSKMYVAGHISDKAYQYTTG